MWWRQPPRLGVWAEKGLGKKRRGQDPRLGWVWCYLVWIKGTGESVVSEAALTGLETGVGGGFGGGRPEGWWLPPFRLPLSVLDNPTHTGCEGPVCISPSPGKLGGECKCGKGEFTPKAAFQNLGQSLGIPERRGKDYLFLGEEEGHRGEGRG